ncbi:hypothetical protein MC69_009570 [Aeromonas hydrophila]|nr:hypothetical protein MC69_009570 [Aeromonas hydrophila]
MVCVLMGTQEAESRGAYATHPLNPYFVVNNYCLSHIECGKPCKTLALTISEIFRYLTYPRQRSQIQGLQRK